MNKYTELSCSGSGRMFFCLSFDQYTKTQNSRPSAKKFLTKGRESTAYAVKFRGTTLIYLYCHFEPVEKRAKPYNDNINLINLSLYNFQIRSTIIVHRAFSYPCLLLQNRKLCY
jgi:hypothetical protein